MRHDAALGAVRVPASTANLGPGYDSFGAALALHTTATAVPAATADVRVTTSTVGHADRGAHDVPTGDDNLVWQALTLACGDHGWEVPDVALHVETAIPLAAGLGSSSAAIVAGIALARLLAGADASVPFEDPDRLVGDRVLLRTAVGMEGHPDNVAPALIGGLVLAATTDDGDLVVRLAPPPAALAPVLLVPPTTSSTEVARGLVPESLSRDDVIAQVARAGHVTGAMLGAWPADARVVGDRLHEPPRDVVLGPGAGLLARLRAASVHAWLSGAGPSIALTVPGRTVRLPEAISEAARAAGHDVLRLAWDRQGARSCVPDGCGVAGTPGCLDCPLGSVR